MKPLILLLMLAACTPAYSGPVSNHFNGKTFYNPGPPQPHSFASVLKWKFLDNEPRPAWPRTVTLPPAPTPQPRVNGTALTVTPLGHATVLIQTAGLNILTDPVLLGRASPFSFMGPQRATPVPFPLENLPPIDVVLISHSHYDHLSLPTLKWLAARDHPRIITPLGIDKILNPHLPASKPWLPGYLATWLPEGIPSEPHDWNDTLSLGNHVTITLNPVQHWSARTPWDRNRTLWTGYTLQTPAGKIFFGGDTGYGNGWWSKSLGEKYGPYKLALLPIGAYAPRWFMSYSHMNPEEALLAAQDLHAENILPIHWGTFHLTDEAREEPPTHLLAALKNTPYTPQTARPLLPGQPWQLSPQ